MTKKNDPPKSDAEIAKDLAARSGNNFHCKVVNYLRSRNWHVSISPWYVDSSTDKPRELDLIAEKLYSPARSEDRVHSCVVVVDKEQDDTNACQWALLQYFLEVRT
jgi:hypothetical protein